MTPYSEPVWDKPVAKTLIVLGSAPCLYADLDAALSLRPEAHIIAVNEACGAVEHIHHMLAGHCDKAQMFRDYRAKRFPNADPVPVHATQRADMPLHYPVDYWWHEAKVGGTSAWKAARIGVGMGYEEIILAGCPLDLSGYFNPNDTKKFKHECRRVGEPLDDGSPSQLTLRYRREFLRNAERYGSNVRSMSGWSREVLGAP